MRFHTVHTAESIRAEFDRLKGAGMLQADLELTLELHRSQSHPRAFEMSLAAATYSGPDSIYGKRRTVTAYGTPYALPNGDRGFGPTYSEWGWLMSALYRHDPVAQPEMIDSESESVRRGAWRSPMGDRWIGYSSYDGVSHFDEMTGYVFDGESAHIVVPASELHTGDVMIGKGVSGNGVYEIRSIEEGARGTLRVSIRNAANHPLGYGSLWTDTVTMRPARAVLISRPLVIFAGVNA